MSRKPADFLAPLFVVGLLAAFFLHFIRAELVDLGRPSIWSSFDLESYFLPRFWLGARTLLHGQVPLWNPYEFAGIPLLATGQPGVFYPPTVLLFGFLPRAAAHWAYLVGHYVFAACAMFYFLRRERVGNVGVFVGVVVWLFSIPVLSSNYHPPRIAHLSWLPWLFAFVERAGRGERRGFVALALIVALQITAGYPEFGMDEAVLVGIHALVSWRIGAWTTPPWKSLPRIGTAFVLGALSAAVQLVPLGELGRLSSRESLVPHGAFSFPAALGPGPLVHVVPGLIVFVLIGALARRSLPAVLGFATCLAIYGGGWKLLRLVPGFSFIRFPLVWLFLWTFYLAWLAALGADEVVRHEGTPQRAKLHLAGLVAAAIFLGALYVLGWRWAMEGATATLAKSWALSVQNGTAAAVGIAGVVAIAAVAVVSRRRAVSPAAWMAAVSVAVVAQLCAFPFGARTASFHPPTKKGRAGRYEVDVHPLTGRALSPEDALYGFEVTDRVASPLGVEQSFLPSRQRKIVEKLGYVSLFGWLDWKAVSRAQGYLEAMNVELVVAPPFAVEAFAARGFVERSRSEVDSFLINPARMGSAWVNYAVLNAPSDAQALEYFVGPLFDPRREVMLEQSTRHAFPIPGLGTPRATAPLAEHRESSTRATWDVDLAQPGIFVASESAYPGWEATVDGHRVQWLTADYVLRGVELDAGRHQVSFEYRPGSFRLGATLSALGLAGIALVALWRRSASKGPATPASS
ncbi:MAG TPA: YfhO family protein [Polyangiaceae bacterium]|jgi:hypothetical protein|nr:YfhO family protein [Polyangiaceae bacterium]